MEKKRQKGWVGLSILTAIASSLCCVAPVLAMVAGTSGMATTFSWIEPARPYLIVSTFVILGVAWWLKFRPVKQDYCGCELPQKSPFVHSKKFLLIVTLVAIVMTAFPYYSHVFYSANETVNVEFENLEEETIEIDGMTCEACEQHVNHAISQLAGIKSVETSYQLGQTTVYYDRTKTSLIKIVEAINSTGYYAIE